MSVTDIIWLVALIIFAVAEAETVSLVSIWFGAGALVALISSWLGAPLVVQIIIFLAVSGLCLLCLRPLVQKYIKPKITATNTDSLIGAEGILTEAVDNLQGNGTVQLRGLAWTARSSDDTPIPAGTRVRVDRIEGVRAYVTPVGASAPTK